MDKVTRHRLDYIIGGLLICCCFFGNLFPCLNIDVKLMVLTPLRWMAIVASFYCGVGWLKKLKQRQVLGWCKSHKVKVGVLLFLVAWSISGILWMIFGSYNELAFSEVMGIVTIFMYAFCLFSLIQSEEDIEFYLNIIVLSGIVMSILAHIEIMSGSMVEGTSYYYTLEERIKMGKTLFPPTVVFHNTNDLASFLLLCLTITAYKFLKADTIRGMTRWTLVAIVLLSPVPFINSTIFEIAFIFLLLITILLTICMRGGKRVTRLLKSLGIGIFGIIYFFPLSSVVIKIGNYMNNLYHTYKSKQILVQGNINGELPKVETTDKLTESIEGNFELSNQEETPSSQTITSNATSDQDTFFSQIAAAQNGYGTIHIRLWHIRAGWDFFLQSPLIGFGPGGFRKKIQENRYYYEAVRGYIDPHNFYVELLVQYGGLLFLGYLLLLVCLFISSFKQTVKEIKNRVAGLGVGALLLIVGFSIAAIIPSSIIKLTPVWIFYLVAVCMVDKFKKSKE